MGSARSYSDENNILPFRVTAMIDSNRWTLACHLNFRWFVKMGINDMDFTTGCNS